ncbi:MAG: hypothetical protein WCL32_16955, partial [Planctomycetota bacterium]
AIVQLHEFFQHEAREQLRLRGNQRCQDPFNKDPDTLINSGRRFGQLGKIGQALSNGFGVALQKIGNVLETAVPELGGFDRGITTTILLAERVIHRLH